MGTRSLIAVVHGGVYKSIYCHWDGYPEGVGNTLVENYDSKDADELIKLGDLSVLEKNINPPKGVNHTFNHPVADTCIFYGRDRGEDGVDFKSSLGFGEFLQMADTMGVDYVYVLRNEWMVAPMYGEGKGKLVSVTKLLTTAKETV